jgi:hypothetical protein
MRRAENRCDFGARAAVESLIGIAAPVSHEEALTRPECPCAGEEGSEVGRTMDQRRDPVARGPRCSVFVTTVQ